MSVLDVRNLSVQYLTENGASEIVKDISFKVEKGEIAGLVGESGSKWRKVRSRGLWVSPDQEKARSCWP